jgi:ATP-binding cassette, subfamily B, multidrug efflux pump
MFRWLETRIDPFVRAAIVQPPNSLFSFYWHYVRPIWPAFVLVLFFDLLAALSEVVLATFLARLIDLMKAAGTPANFFSDHADLLLLMALVVLIVRPAVVFVYDIIKNQVLSPPFKPASAGRRMAMCSGKVLAFFRTNLQVGSPIN